ncbi:ATP--guanido phosphotransferase [Leptospira yanagawae]|uniref:ATP--guanido phosphotransferase n=1 Tax=Leptospira yanagawae TaxID=293069 RepID=A0ABY2M436_9LEPT|nr:ATP--guanido phosphotransferase [Leptospira yanagawae]TGL20129.1 ATP--guanido phosphotransferase [Leptospira yanagawae]
MKYCRFCGTTESQFRISGKFGCEHCVTQFFDPIKSKPSPIPKSLIEEIEGIFTKSESKTKILMVRTRLTRNLSHSLFPFYDLKKEEVKRLLAENELMDFLDEETNSFFTEKDSMIRLYFGGEDHLRFEALRRVLPCESLDPAEAVDLAVAKRQKLKSLLRFIFKKQNWAFAKGIGYVSSCPTNVGRGRRDSILLGIEPGVDPSFFSLFEKLSEFGIEFAPSTDHRRESLGKFRGLVVKISWKNAYAVQKRQFYKILGLRGSL